MKVIRKQFCSYSYSFNPSVKATYQFSYDEHAPGATCLTKLSGAFLKKSARSRPSGGTKDDQIDLDSF